MGWSMWIPAIGFRARGLELRFEVKVLNQMEEEIRSALFSDMDQRLAHIPKRVPFWGEIKVKGF